ncbi:MAG: hypothetical protein ACKO9B_02340 [Planctomycetota bacterium]
MSDLPGRGSRGTAGTWLGLRRGTLVALVAIAVLLVPLALLSLPADAESAGGLLARQRRAYGLSQANLGEIDPTSETIRLATLGLKNIAVTLLWDRANHYKKVEDWTNLSATLEQMTKLQPNFYTVWDFQAHNLSYNISVEFDDYHDRYAWVMKGIEFLRQGIGYNTNEPRLFGRMGWFIGQKIGKADEKVQYRRLFKDDNDFHERDRKGGRVPADRDNWLVGREKYLEGQQLVDKGAPLRTTALIFHSEPMMTAINHARAIEEEGVFGNVARDAWAQAGSDMMKFAEREIPTTWNVPIQLLMRETKLTRAEQLQGELEALLPGQFAALEAKLRDGLSDAQKAALAVPPADRTEDQAKTAYEATVATAVNWPMVARQAPADARGKARQLAAEYVEAAETAEIIARYREIVNFDYWKAACEAEVTEAALEAREQTWLAGQEFDAARLQNARKAYETAFASWRKVLDSSEILRNDQIGNDELVEVIFKYRRLLEQLDEPFPVPFILQDVLTRAPAPPEPPADQPRQRPEPPQRPIPIPDGFEPAK